LPISNAPKAKTITTIKLILTPLRCEQLIKPSGN
jgi:hypothetical protein